MLLQTAMQHVGENAPQAVSQAMDMGASITHYMGLLMDNQPWNLIVFMAIPVILVEALTVIEAGKRYSREGRLGSGR